MPFRAAREESAVEVELHGATLAQVPPQLELSYAIPPRNPQLSEVIGRRASAAAAEISAPARRTGADRGSRALHRTDRSSTLLCLRQPPTRWSQALARRQRLCVNP